MAGGVVVDAAGGDVGLHDRIIRRKWAHGGRAVPAGKALAAGEGPQPARTLADEEASNRHRPHERSDGPDQTGQVLQHSALEDLGVVPIRGGERLRDGGAEHDVFAGGAPVVEEYPTQGVTGLFDIDREIGLADRRGQLGVFEERNRGERGRIPLPIRQREGIVLRLSPLHRNQCRRGRSQQDSGERQAQAPLPTVPGVPGRYRHRKAAYPRILIVPNPRSHP